MPFPLWLPKEVELCHPGIPVLVSEELLVQGLWGSFFFVTDLAPIGLSCDSVYAPLKILLSSTVLHTCDKLIVMLAPNLGTDLSPERHMPNHFPLFGNRAPSHNRKSKKFAYRFA